MNKKIPVIIFTAALFLVASLFYYTNLEETLSANNSIEDADAQLIKNVIEIERNLVIAQSHGITFEEFKNKTGPFIHTRYEDAFFDELEKAYNGSSGYLAESTKPPIYRYISKIYSDKNNNFKNIYVRIPMEGTTSQNAKLYIFNKDNGIWKIVSVTNYILVIDRNEPKKIIEKFTHYNGTPIEYEHVNIIE